MWQSSWTLQSMKMNSIWRIARAWSSSSSMAPSRIAKPLSMLLLFEFVLLVFFTAFFWPFWMIVCCSCSTRMSKNSWIRYRHERDITKKKTAIPQKTKATFNTTSADAVEADSGSRKARCFPSTWKLINASTWCRRLVLQLSAFDAKVDVHLESCVKIEKWTW